MRNPGCGTLGENERNGPYLGVPGVKIRKMSESDGGRVGWEGGRTSEGDAVEGTGNEEKDTRER